MQMPHVDYGPLYRAAAFRTAGQKAGLLGEYASQTRRGLELEQQGLDLRQKALTQQRELFPWKVGVDVANTVVTLINAGLQVYGIVQQRKMLQAKNDAMDVEPIFKMKALDMVRNGQYATFGEGKEIRLSSEYDTLVSDTVKELSDKYKGFPEIQLWIEGAIKDVSNVAKLGAYSEISNKEFQATINLFETGLKKSIDASVAMRSDQPWREFLESSFLDGVISLKQKDSLYAATEAEITSRRREKLLRDTVNVNGEPAALKALETDSIFAGITETERNQYRALISNQGEQQAVINNKAVSDIVEQIKQAGGSLDDQIDAVRSSSIPVYWKQGAIEKLILGKETQELSNMVAALGGTEAVQAAESMYGLGGARGEDPVRLDLLKQEIATTEKREQNYWTSEVDRRIDEYLKNGASFISAKNDLLHKVPSGWRAFVTGLIEDKQKVWAHDQTMNELNQAEGKRNNWQHVAELIDKVEKDVEGRYKGGGGLGGQKHVDLNILEARRQELENLYKSSMADAAKAITEDADDAVRSLVEVAKRGITDWRSTRKAIDDYTGKASDSVMNWARDEIRGLVPDQFKTMFDGLKAIKKDIRKINPKLFPEEGENDILNTAYGHVQNSLLDFVQENPSATDTQIQQKKQDLINMFAAETLDVTSAQYGKTGKMSLLQMNDLQAIIDTGRLDAPTWEDPEARIHYPYGAEKNMLDLQAYQRDILGKYTGAYVSKPILEREGPYDVTARSIFKTSSGDTYTFFAGDKGMVLAKGTVTREGMKWIEVAEQDRNGDLIKIGEKEAAEKAAALQSAAQMTGEQSYADLMHAASSMEAASLSPAARQAIIDAAEASRKKEKKKRN